ncbi:MAG: FAD/NAD(P)-binding protein [Thermoplasmata archaeon]
MAPSTAVPPSGPIPSPHPWAPVPFTLRTRSPETADTVSLVLEPPVGLGPLAFRPGQFNMLYVFGVGEAAISISGAADENATFVHTVRAAGKISQALVAASPGEVVGVRGPYGTGWPLEAALGKDVVVVAGGLGIAPVRPIVYELLQHRDRYGRVEVVYGARTPADLVYYDEIQRWRARTDLRFQTTVDTAGRDWYGDVGVVTTRLPDARFDPERTVAFLCGPEVMMKLTAQALEARGIPDDRIWLSLERNMKCALGVCGHCQFGPEFVCRDGPVFRFQEIRRFLAVREM